METVTSTGTTPTELTYKAGDLERAEPPQLEEKEVTGSWSFGFISHRGSWTIIPTLEVCWGKSFKEFWLVWLNVRVGFCFEPDDFDLPF